MKKDQDMKLTNLKFEYGLNDSIKNKLDNEVDHLRSKLDTVNEKPAER